LGAGTGLVGIVAALLGAKVTLTDKEPQTILLEENASRNREKDTHLVVKKLLWGESVEDLEPPFDVIIASECIYYEELVEPLLTTIDNLSSSKTITFVSFEEHRPDSVVMFLEEAQKKGFRVQHIPIDDLHPIYRSNKIKVITLHKTNTQIINPL